jgi:polygalacturonase
MNPLPFALFRCLLLSIALAVTVGAAIKSKPGDWAMVDEITAMIELPRIPAKDFPITDFGAKPGADALPAIKAAIAAATQAGGGRVIVPAGEWLSNGPVHLKSRINFHVAEGAVLKFSPEAKHYLPVVLTRWEGTELYTYSPLVYAFEVEDVAITGKGTIDGNGASEFLAWIKPEFQADDVNKLRRMGSDGTPAAQRIFGEGTHLRAPLIQFFRAKRVLLEDYTLLNAPFWVNHLVYTDHATVRRVRVDSHHANNDGVDVDSSRYVLIEHCYFRTGDDSVVVKSGRDLDGRQIAKPSEYVVVRHNDMGGEDGIALGSEMSGDVRHVFFTDNILRKGVSAIRFKANLDRGGTVEHIRVRNFTVESFDNLFWFQLDYPGQLGGNFPSTYRDIVFENFTVERAGTIFDGDAPAAAPLRGVILRNIAIKQADRTFVLKNVEGLVLENVTLGDQRIDGHLDWRKAK